MMSKAGRTLWAAVRRLPSIPALALYAATLVAEVPVLFTRMLVIFVISVLALLIAGDPTGAAGTLLYLAFIPFAVSLLALITPVGAGWWWAQRMGARAPSQRERQAYQDALALLAAHSTQPLRAPRRFYVLDTPEPDAAVCGHALVLSRGLLEGEHLAAVIAHELGHLHSADGRLTAALNRLVLQPVLRPAEGRGGRDTTVVVSGDRVVLGFLGLRLLLWIIRRTLTFAKGGLGLRITAPFWGSYWREREYAADAHAALLGEADELADFLELHALIHDHPVPFIWLTEHTHPPSELRVEKLRDAATKEHA